MGNCIGTIMSHLLSASETFTKWMALISLVTCIILCLVCMLAFGIGLGYNYSFVDYKTKHVYVAGYYKKVRPTIYHGPGYYKPSTRVRPKAKKVYRASDEPEDFEVIRKIPEDLMTEDLPSESPIKLLEAAEGELPIRPTFHRGENPMHNVYFTVSKTLPNTQLRPFRKFNNYFNVSSVSTPGLSVNKNESKVNIDIADNDKSSNLLQRGLSVKNETTVNVDIAGKSSNLLKRINTTEEYSSPEAIRVDFAKVKNVDNSSIPKTIVSLKQLLSFLTMLREKNQNFSVQVITL